MELTQLAQFKAIAECESLSRAAEKIYISQPSLSAALQKLEDELGARLFERTKGRIFLNEAGKRALLSGLMYGFQAVISPLNIYGK
ncbi:MAG: LysR family transcriptional regulator [Treponema sp.]|jgi:DNA-binding transcriptional LysR family regulator|nr:LysR family transcriptional regulator [Treponema sp.]